MRDNTSIFVSVLSPIVVQVTEEDLQVGTLKVDVPQQKLLRIRVFDQRWKPAANKLISYQNLRDVPTAWYTVRADENGEVLLCGVNMGSYMVGSPECDPVHVVVEDSDLDDREIVLQPRKAPLRLFVTTGLLDHDKPSLKVSWVKMNAIWPCSLARLSTPFPPSLSMLIRNWETKWQ